MTMDHVNDLRDLDGRDVVDPDGDKIGTVTGIYIDDETGEPNWLAVKTGWFGSNISFVPFQGLYLGGDEVVVSYQKDTVKSSPNFDADGHLTPEEEDELYAYYGVAEGGYAGRAATSGVAARTGDVKGRSGNDAMTRSEEELDVTKRRTQTGRVRLHKWVETEQVQMTVPIRREKARLVTEPITARNRDEALSGPDLREAEHEVTLSEEEVDIQKRTVPKERVRLEKEVETEEVPVNETVRKERIKMDRDDAR